MQLRSGQNYLLNMCNKNKTDGIHAKFGLEKKKRQVKNKHLVHHGKPSRANAYCNITKGES